MSDALTEFLGALGLVEEPFGIFYTDTEPAQGLSPNPGPPLSVELEQAGQVDWGAVFGNFSCVLGKVWQARKKHTAAYFEAGRYGCPGGSFYLGFHKPQLDTIAQYISTGIPGTPMEGERYLCSPESARRFFELVDPRPAPARFCVMQPLSLFAEGTKPELVTFFARGEVLTGLCNLAAFVSDDLEVVPRPLARDAASW